MKQITYWLFTCLVATLLLTNCNVHDPLGATTREQVRSEGAIRVAELESNAQMESARYAKESRIAVTQAWTQTLPTLLLIIVAGTLVGIILYFQGKAYLIQIERSTGQPNSPLASVVAQKLSTYTQQSGKQLDVVDGIYYLRDPESGKRWRALPKRG